MVKHSVRKELRGVLVFVGIVWCVFVVGLVLPFSINSCGVTPRSIIGLVGVPLMPFLHADLKHLLSNTVPLTILLLLLAGSKANSWTIVAFIVFMSGAMLWLFGRPATHGLRGIAANPGHGPMRAHPRVKIDPISTETYARLVECFQAHNAPRGVPGTEAELTRRDVSCCPALVAM